MMQFEEATKLNDVVMTSSSGPIPNARTARCRAEVPLFTAIAYFDPTYAANFFSNRATHGPKLSWPDRRTRVTYSTSKSVMSGQQSGTFMRESSFSKLERARILCRGECAQPVCLREFWENFMEPSQHAVVIRAGKQTLEFVDLFRNPAGKFLSAGKGHYPAVSRGARLLRLIPQLLRDLFTVLQANKFDR